MNDIKKIHENWKNYINKTLLVEDELPGGAADDMPDQNFDPIQLEIGIEHELEHTGDRNIAKNIAKDHLTEDPNYYRKIQKIEKD